MLHGITILQYEAYNENIILLLSLQSIELIKANIAVNRSES